MAETAGPELAKVDSEGTAAPDEAGPEGTGLARRRPWAAIAGVIVFLYAVFFAVEVVAAGFDHRLYNRLHQLQSNVGARLVFALVVLSMLFHGLNGLRIVVCGLLPSMERRDAALRTTVQFLTFAMWVPVAFAICWPSISRLAR